MRQGSPDDFQTPPKALDPLLPYLKKEWVIWECANGNGNLSNKLLYEGYEVISTDIKVCNFDFLTNKPEFFDCIVTNPPFSLKEEFIARCFELGVPFALLLPLTTLESEKRHKIFRKYPGIQLIIPNKRYNFETPSGKGGGILVRYCLVHLGIKSSKSIKLC